MRRLTNRRKRLCLNMLKAGFGDHDIAVALAIDNGFRNSLALNVEASAFLPSVTSFIRRLRAGGKLEKILGLRNDKTRQRGGGP